MNADQSADHTMPGVFQRLICSGAVRCYTAGIALVVLTLLVSDALNPRGIRGGSWFDTLTIPLGCLSLLLCVVAPLISRRSLPQRFALLVAAVFGFSVACIASWAVSMRLIGAFPF